MTSATSYQNAAPATFPGKGLGITALILAFFFNLIGLILGIVALNQSKQAGYKNTPAVAAIWVGAAFMVLTIVAVVVVFGLAAATSTS